MGDHEDMNVGPSDNVIAFPGRRVPMHEPVLLPRREDRVTFVVRIDLDDTEPPIWRRLRLASDLTLAQLHEILQITMGWTDSHLHSFAMDAPATDGRSRPFRTPFDEDDTAGGIQEADVRLDQVFATVGDGLTYVYDFGDYWQHTLRLEGVEARGPDDPDAVCVGGERACPPEDVGGIGGYDRVLEGLTGAGSDDEWLVEVLAWLPEGFDPAEFSVNGVNEALSGGPLPALTAWHPAIGDLLHRAGGSGLSPVGELIRLATRDRAGLTDEQVAAAVHPYAHLLRTVGEGVKLTDAGYLPPRIVKAVLVGLTLGIRRGPGHRETQTLPVIALRESAVALGLLRKSRGTLLVTKVGRQLLDDPPGLWRHIAPRLPLGRPYERDAGLIALLVAASGNDWYGSGRLGAALLDSLGWEVAGGDLRGAAMEWAGPTMDVLESLAGWSRDPAHKAAVAAELLRRPEQ